MESNVYKLKINNNIPFLFFFLFLVIVISCTTIKAGIELLLIDFNGRELIENEGKVRIILETILLTPENYTLTVYTRQVFSPEVKRTPSLYHSFYTVTSSEMSFITLSFSGTKKRIQSEGAWAINTESDMKSYLDFKYGTNEWDVQETLINKGVNTKMTIENIIYRIDNNINYYYNDHKNDRDGRENCNTALQNTLVEND
jgi:hypothetical protein